MKVTTLPETGKESKGHISAYEMVNKQDLLKRKLTEGVISQLKEDAAKLGADGISNLKINYLAVPSGFGLDIIITADAEAVKL